MNRLCFFYSPFARRIVVLAALACILATPPAVQAQRFKYINLAERKDLRTLTLETDAEVSDADLKALARSASLEELYLCAYSGKPTLTAEGIKALAGLKRLHTLTLDGSRSESPGIAELQGKGELAGLTGLRYLGLRSLKANDAAFAELGTLKGLQEVYLLQVFLTDARLTEMGKLPRLHKLTVTHIYPEQQVTAAGFKGLAAAAGIRDLSLVGVPVNDETFRHLGGLKDLESLRVSSINMYELDNVILISNAGVKHLTGLKKLTSLNLTNRKSRITDVGVKHLSELTDLTSLGLCYSEVTDEGAAHLTQLTKLRSLDLSATAISGAGLKHLSGLTRLEYLDLRGNTGLTAAGLQHLYGLKNLRTLRVSGTKMVGTPERDAQLALLRKVLPKCEIITARDETDP